MKTPKEWFDKYKSNADQYLSIPAIEAIQKDAEEHWKAKAKKYWDVLDGESIAYMDFGD